MALRMSVLPVLAALALAPAMAAAACPVPDAAELARTRAPLFEKLRTSASPAEARAVAGAIWSSWASAPDARAQDLLDRAVRYMGRGDLKAAETLLSELVGYCPAYPEGWNQRAFARYLAGRYDAALADIERVLKLEPRHFGALTGKGLTLLRQGHRTRALDAIRAARKIHPWIEERRLLPPSRKI